MVKTLRSLIHEKFSEEIRVQIELISRRRDIVNQEKHEEIIKLLQNNGIENIVPLGPGTNRYAFKLDGFVIKVATDHDGKIDNLKEFKMAKRLYPYVAKTYEVSENGTLLVAEYIPPFGSYVEMSRHADRIKEILRELSAVYLIGDVGLTSKNFSNWGLRNATKDPVCLDFAYVYEVSSELFVCRSSKCRGRFMLLPNDNFTELYCSNPECGKRYQFEDIRTRIGNDIHRHEIGDLSMEGYRLLESGVETELDVERSNYLAKAKPKKPSVPIAEPATEEYLEEETEMGKIDQSAMVASMTNIPFGSPRRLPMIQITAPSGGEKAETAADAGIEIMKGSEKNVPAFSAPITHVEITAPGEEKPAGDRPEAEVVHATVKQPLSGKFVEMEVVQVDTEPKIPSMELSGDEEHIPGEEDFIMGGDDAGSSEGTDHDAPPETEETTEGKENHQPIMESFREHFFGAVSDMSNIIGAWVENKGAYQEVQDYLSDKNMMGHSFYRATQNAVFRSLINFLGFETKVDESNTPGRKGPKKMFVPPVQLNDTPVTPTVLFIQRYWKDPHLNRLSDPNEFMNTYRKYYRNSVGIQGEWKPYLIDRMTQKMPISVEGAEKLADMICAEWCEFVVTKTPLMIIREIGGKVRKSLREKYNDWEYDDASSTEITIASSPNYRDSGQEIKIIVDMDLMTITGYVGIKIVKHEAFDNVADLIDKVTKAFVPGEDVLAPVYEKWMADVRAEAPKGSAVMSASIVHSEEADGENEDGGEGDLVQTVTGVRIEVYPDDACDVIRLITSDFSGDIIIPFYAKIDEVDLNTPATPSLVDDRNGIWDWLTVLVPDMVFRTNDPTIYLENNENDLSDDVIRCVILDVEDGVYTMGIYYLDSVVYMEPDDDDEEEITDMDVIQKIFRIIRDNTMFTKISHLKRSLSADDLIRDEDEIRQFIDILPGDDGEEEEEMQEQVKSNMDELEAAAAAFVMGDGTPAPGTEVGETPAETTAADEPKADEPAPAPAAEEQPQPEPKPVQSGVIPVVHRKKRH